VSIAAATGILLSAPLGYLADRAGPKGVYIGALLAALYNELLTIALPVWLLSREGAPLWLVSVALVINTTACVLLQVRASRGIDSPVAGSRASRKGALIVGIACVLFGLAGLLPPAAMIASVMIAAVIHVLGELLLSSATWAVVYDLAPDWAHGQYQGTYVTGRQIGNMVAPPLLTALVLGLGGGGWVVVGAIFAVAAAAYPPVVRWGVRTRPAVATAHLVSVRANAHVSI
jgi:MFS family permease